MIELNDRCEEHINREIGHWRDVAGRLGWLLMICSVAGQVFLPILLVSNRELFIALTLCSALLMIGLILIEAGRNALRLTPAEIVSIGGLFFFVLRPLTMSKSGSLTAGAEADSRLFDAVAQTAAIQAILQVLLLFDVFAAVYLWRTRAGSTPSSEQRGPCRSIAGGRTEVALVLSMLGASAASAVLVTRGGGLNSFVEGLSIRSSFLSGQFLFTLAYLPVTVSLLLYILSRRSRGLREWTVLGSLGTLVAIGSALTGGGRGPVILGVLLPLLLVKQLGARPFRMVPLITFGALLLVGGMLLGVGLRENVYTSGEAARQLRDDPVAFVVDRLNGGSETRPFDSLVVLNLAALSGNVTMQQGSTYIDTWKWFLPGSVVEEKGGGNEWFTRTYLPRFYYPDRVQTSISAPGEAYANFGWPGIILAGLGLGLAGASLLKRSSSRRLGDLVAYAMVTPVLFSFTRGDAYHNISLALLLIAGSYCAGALIELPDGGAFRRTPAFLGENPRRD